MGAARRTQAPLSPAARPALPSAPTHIQMWMQTHKRGFYGNVCGGSQTQVVLSSRAGRITLSLGMYLISMRAAKPDT